MSNIFRDMTMARDAQEASLGDTLDVKSGIVLAIITVLGTLTGALLASSGLGKAFQIGQLAALVCLVAGTVFAVAAVFPRDYFLPEMPDKYQKWIDDIQQLFKDDPAEAESQVLIGMTQIATQRIEINHKINLEKSRYLSLSFWPTLAALAINIITLAGMGMSKVLS